MIWADQPPEVDLSGVATVVMASSEGAAPTMDDGTDIHVSDAAGAGAQVQSLFQVDATAMRFIQPASWHWISAGAAAVTGVAW